MSAIILDEIPFRIDYYDFLNSVQLREGSEDARRVRELIEKARSIGKPRGMCREVFVSSKEEDQITAENITLKSRVLRVNLDNANKIIPYIVTCGRELHSWWDNIVDVLENYWAGEIKEEILRQAKKYVLDYVKENYLPGKSASMNPGSLADWSIREQEKIFKLLGDPEGEIGVSLTSSSLMVPIKSISGVRFATERDFKNCMICPRPNCPSRSAPYDEKLYREKYR